MIDSLLKIYFKEISKYKPLPIKTEKELIVRIRNGDQKAKDLLIKANLKFVVKVAKHYENRGVEFADLINIGNRGLLKSLDYFNENKNVKLITYAVWWIRQYILVAMAESQSVKVSLESIAILNKIKKIRNKLEQTYKRPVTADDLVNHINKSKKTIEICQAIELSTTSLNSKILDDIELIDTITDKNQETKDWLIQRQIETLVNSLDERHCKVIKMCYGLQNNDDCTIKSISLELGVSYQRVCQIRDEALKKLRKVIGKSHEILN